MWMGRNINYENIRTASATTESSHTDPDWLYLYFQWLGLGWATLGLAFGLSMIPLYFLSGLIFGAKNDAVGIAAGLSLSIFCVAGGLDASWRSVLAYSARSRYRLAKGLDESSRRAMAISKTYDWTLLLQLVAAAVAVAILLDTR